MKGREAALRCRHSGSRTPSQGVEPQPSGPPASAPSPPLCDRGRTRLAEKMTSHQNSGWQAALGVCAAALRALGGPETSGSDCPSALARHLPLLLGPRGTGRCVRLHQCLSLTRGSAQAKPEWLGGLRHRTDLNSRSGPVFALRFDLSRFVCWV